MLIEQQIKRLCDNGVLVQIKPLDWRIQIKRPMYAARDLNRFLTQNAHTAQANGDRRRLQALFDRFISGQTISVAFERHIKATDMKRLTPKSAEVWEFKIRKGSQLRVFGRFALVNTIIALTGPVFRAGCNYSVEKTRCQQEWQKIFNGYSPVYGSKLSDYISGTNVVPFGNP